MIVIYPTDRSLTVDINLNIDFKDIDLNAEIGKVVDPEGDYIGDQTLAGAVIEKLVLQAAREPYHRELAKRVEAIRDEEIRKVVAPAIQEALTTPFRLTNTYGETKGEPVTMREYIVAVAQKWMNERADSYRSEKGTNIQALVRAQVEAAFKAEIAEAVKSAREAVAAQIGGSISSVVTEAVRNGLRATQ